MTNRTTIDAALDWLDLQRVELSESLQTDIADFEQLYNDAKKKDLLQCGASLDFDAEQDYTASMDELRRIYRASPKATAQEILQQANIVGKSTNDQWGVNLIALQSADGQEQPVSAQLHTRIIAPETPSRTDAMPYNYAYMLNEIADRLALQIFEENLLPPQYGLEIESSKIKTELA